MALEDDVDVDDSEQVALSMLRRMRIDHPLLRAWADEIAYDAEYCVTLDEFVETDAGESLIDKCTKSGYDIGDPLAAILTSTSRTPAQGIAVQKADAAAALLAQQVVEYRRLGRPHRWQNGSEELSMRSALSEFQQALTSIWGGWDQCPREK